MQVRVLLFGMLKDVMGRSQDSVSLPEGATVADLLGYYQQQAPKFAEYAKSIAVSVNQEYAAVSVKLKDGDEVGLLPPVSGGSGRLQGEGFSVTIVREKIDTAAIAAQVRHPEDGAVALFDGIVRNNTRGRRTLYLDYEAYEEMALKQMRELAERTLQEHKVREVAIVHRLGRLEIGESSVFIAVASAHRGAAFDACRWLIDTLKKTVPIWKKEYFEDGAVWADGEAFPEEIAGGKKA
jgi:MoaE-MoaD fusion protein